MSVRCLYFTLYDGGIPGASGSWCVHTFTGGTDVTWTRNNNNNNTIKQSQIIVYNYLLKDSFNMHTLLQEFIEYMQ